MTSEKNLEHFKEVFCATSYVVFLPKFTAILRLYEKNSHFDDWLRNYKFYNWIFVTGYNPRGKKISVEANLIRHRKLLIDVKLMSWKMTFGEARPLGSWLAEPGVFIFDIPLIDVSFLAESYGQLAVVTGHCGDVAKLCWVQS